MNPTHEVIEKLKVLRLDLSEDIGDWSHSIMAIEAALALLQPVATPDEGVSYGNARCQCGHLSNAHACDREQGDTTCSRCGCDRFIWDRTPIPPPVATPAPAGDWTNQDPHAFKSDSTGVFCSLCGARREDSYAHYQPSSSPREPQKDETLREKVLPGAMRVVEAIKRDLAPDLDENDGGQILVWLRDFGIECAGLKSEPREPHAALIAEIRLIVANWRDRSRNNIECAPFRKVGIAQKQCADELDALLARALKGE